MLYVSKKLIFVSILFLATTASSTLGCAGSAMDAVSRAHAAIKSAQEAGAEKYAPVEMKIAQTAFDLAEKSLMEGGYSNAKLFAKEAEQQALVAQKMAVELKRYDKPESPPNISVSTTQTPAAASDKNDTAAELASKNPDKQPDPSLDDSTDSPPETFTKKRYVAVAQRRIINAAFATAREQVEQGKIEIEVWVAPNGTITRVLLVEGDVANPLARQVLDGMNSLKLDPFPSDMKQETLKIRVKFNTMAK